jgi:hypothetical protein
MDSSLWIACIFGILILGSYALILKDYKNHDYWVGIPSSSKSMFYVFWVIAAIGFIWYILSYQLFDSKQEGLFSYKPWIRPLILSIVLFASLMWSICIYMYFNKRWSKVWTVLTLIIVAIGTILLLAGEAESNAPWHRILGLMGFAMTTVLIDPIMWNARFILLK